MTPGLLTIEGAVVLAAAAATYWLTGAVLRFARHRAMLDMPSERSSHSEPTPRGGGLAIVVTVLSILLVGGVAGWIPAPLCIAMGGGGVLVAWVGWRDDRRATSPAVRAGFQLLAAGWAVATLGGFPDLNLAGHPIHLGLIGSALAVIGIVWAINLFNFMDGIDGIAGVEAATVALTGSMLLYFTGATGGAMLSAAIGASAVGFLGWNWMPARIFMGDVGSSFLGFAFGVLAVWSENLAAVPAVWWGLAALLFVFDSTITLIRRAFRGEKVLVAHRSHAYQRLTQSGWSHAAATASVLALNLVLSGLTILGFTRHWDPLFPLGAGVLVCLTWYLAIERRRPM